jgi:hypothetical protein
MIYLSYFNFLNVVIIILIRNVFSHFIIINLNFNQSTYYDDLIITNIFCSKNFNKL